MALWWEPGDDTAGLVSKSARTAGTLAALLGNIPLYLLSSKLVMKEAASGGAFAWHQVSRPAGPRFISCTFV